MYIFFWSEGKKCESENRGKTGEKVGWLRFLSVSLSSPFSFLLSGKEEEREAVASFP